MTWWIIGLFRPVSTFTVERTTGIRYVFAICASAPTFWKSAHFSIDASDAT